MQTSPKHFCCSAVYVLIYFLTLHSAYSLGDLPNPKMAPNLTNMAVFLCVLLTLPVTYLPKVAT
jgi:hypothetical protein